MVLMVTILGFPFFANAVSADPEPVNVTQPDGSQITISLHGSEKQHYTRTPDHYTVLQDTDGYYKYAIDSLGIIKPGKIRARNKADRKPDELRFLNTIQPYVRGKRSNSPLILYHSKRDSSSIKRIGLSPTPLRSTTAVTKKYLIILVSFTDVAFTKINDDFSNMLNQTGYRPEGAIGYTGSVKDYYSENSTNAFLPQFDVYGPVTLSQNMAYYGGNDSEGNDLRPREMILEACAKINSQYNINFSQYDNDHDGEIDNVAVFYAGYAESSGAPANTIWPHQWSVTGATGVKRYNNVNLNTYSCSSELKGASGATMVGIGTFCHEFGHVLGLPDLYDTDAEYNGLFYDSNKYNLMASGNYNNGGNTPPYLSIFEREILGWASATKLSTNTTVTGVEQIGASNKAYYMLTNPTPAPGESRTEWFYLENRQMTGWDSYIPGHGLVISHVDLNDSSVTKYWSQGLGNAYASHPCYDLKEADGIADNDTRAGDPFPGTSGRTFFTDEGTPNALSWSGLASNKPITQIAEANSMISFNFVDNSSEAPTGIEIAPANDEPVISTGACQITISNILSHVAIRLYDISGKLIRQMTTNNSRIDIPVGMKGIYIVQINQNGSEKSVKVPVLK